MAHRYLPSAGVQRSATLVACTLAWLLAAATAFAVDTRWIFDGDGNWTEAEKWSNGEPVDETFHVFIDPEETTATVTLNESRTIGSLVLGLDNALQIESLETDTITLASNRVTVHENRDYEYC